MDYKSIFYGFLLFMVGQVLGWFQLNTQYLYEWWKNKPITSAICFGVPTSIMFWNAWRLTTAGFDSVWSSRFVGSATGFIVFPVLTWFLLGETMFTFKTMSCLALTLMILFIQIYY